jgi:hypothetical protein
MVVGMIAALRFRELTILKREKLIQQSWKVLNLLKLGAVVSFIVLRLATDRMCWISGEIYDFVEVEKRNGFK